MTEEEKKCEHPFDMITLLEKGYCPCCFATMKLVEVDDITATKMRKEFERLWEESEPIDKIQRK